MNRSGVDVNVFRDIASLWYEMPSSSSAYDKLSSCHYSLDYFIVGFCGEWTLGVRIIKTWDYTESKAFFFFSYSDLVEFAESEKVDELKKKFGDLNEFDWRSRLTHRKAFELVKSAKSDLFVSCNCPIITISRTGFTGGHPFVHRNVITLNPQLSQFGFVKFKDPYQAYQDLSMYVGGVLCSHKDKTVVMDDNVMRDKKGFDKWSFRKQGAK
jgi:hypothetical protein